MDFCLKRKHNYCDHYFLKLCKKKKLTAMLESKSPGCFYTYAVERASEQTHLREAGVSSLFTRFFLV